MKRVVEGFEIMVGEVDKEGGEPVTYFIVI